MRVLSFSLHVTDLLESERLFRHCGAVVLERREYGGLAFARLTGQAGQVESVALKLGNEELTLQTDRQPSPYGQLGLPVNHSSFQHVALVVRDVDEALAHVAPWPSIAVASDSAQTIPMDNPTAAGIRAVYLRASDQHFIELIAFPAGKGDPRWQARGALLLGIDHSAIAVASTEKSLEFYRDLLGLQVASTSLNQGVEQEKLMKIPNARVSITSLRGAVGPGVELIEFLRPALRRDPPVSASQARPWQTLLELDDLSRLPTGLAAPEGAAREPVDVSELGLGYRWARVCLDPDGHAVRLVERPAKESR